MIRAEILALEERIRCADASTDSDTSAILGELLADGVQIVGPEGRIFDKQFLLDAHRPPKKQPFTRVEMSDVVVQELGDTAVVTCRGDYSLPGKSFTLRFVRVWHKGAGRWQVVAGSVTGMAG